MSNHWEAMAEVFEEARRRPRDERPAFLDEACRNAPDMRVELDRLLAHYKEAPAFFEDLGHVVPTFSSREPVSESLSAPDPYNLIGTLVAQYQVLDKLGAGGMGVVYKALDIQLERVMALKFMPPPLNLDVETRRRFFAEARAAAALDHPNICAIHEVGETKDGQVYIAMRYYQGETLREKLARGPLPFEQALDYAAQIAQGLARAHAQGIIHRDVKPANVMVAEPLFGEEGYGLVKILDFGLAKMEELHLTRTGATLGTPTYMSPEQLRGETVDHRTDIWSLGVMLYEMLTGARPFQGHARHEMHYLIVNEDPVPVSQHNPAVPEDLEHVVMMCLEKEKAYRYASATDLLADLEVFARGLEASSGPHPVVPQRRSPTAPRGLRARIAALLAVWNRWRNRAS